MRRLLYLLKNTTHERPPSRRHGQPRALGWDQSTEVPVLDLLPATVPLPFWSESPGPTGPVPTWNNGRISTASGLAISCSLPGCARLREEAASAPRGMGRCLETAEGVGLVGQATWGRGTRAGKRIFPSSRGQVGVLAKGELVGRGGWWGCLASQSLPSSFRDSRDLAPVIRLPGQLGFCGALVLFLVSPCPSSAVPPPHVGTRGGDGRSWGASAFF